MLMKLKILDKLTKILSINSWTPCSPEMLKINKWYKDLDKIKGETWLNNK